MTTQHIPLSTSRISAEFGEGVAMLTINNPDRRNALSLEMWEALGDAATALEEERRVRVVVIRGAGGRAFASGADISELSKLQSDAEMAIRYREAMHRTHTTLRALSKPLVAMIEGHCHGAGLGIALLADIRFATPDALFSLPAAKLGVGYDERGFSAMARAIGISSAMDLLFTARTIDADEALSMKMLNFVLPHDDIDRGVRDYAGRIGANAPLTIKATKFAASIFGNAPDENAVRQLAELVDRCLASKDYAEGQLAFKERRAPRFQGD